MSYFYNIYCNFQCYRRHLREILLVITLFERDFVRLSEDLDSDTFHSKEILAWTSNYLTSTKRKILLNYNVEQKRLLLIESLSQEVR